MKMFRWVAKRYYNRLSNTNRRTTDILRNEYEIKKFQHMRSAEKEGQVSLLSKKISRLPDESLKSLESLGHTSPDRV